MDGSGASVLWEDQYGTATADVARDADLTQNAIVVTGSMWIAAVEVTMSPVIEDEKNGCHPQADGTRIIGKPAIGFTLPNGLEDQEPPVNDRQF